MLVLAVTSAPLALKLGALLFGAVVGWNAYFINRYRQTVVIGDLATLISAVGGGAILALFPAQSETFGYYGIGLASGFFAYLALLLVLVWISPNATVDWILGLGGHPTDHAKGSPAAPIERPAVGPTDSGHLLDEKVNWKLPLPTPPI